MILVYVSQLQEHKKKKKWGQKTRPVVVTALCMFGTLGVSVKPWSVSSFCGAACELLIFTQMVFIPAAAMWQPAVAYFMVFIHCAGFFLQSLSTTN